MYKGVFKIAEKNIEINSIYPFVQNMCQKYITTEKPDFIIKISKSDIDFERISFHNKNNSNDLKLDFYLESLAVYRKIAEKMFDYNTLLFHSSVVAVDGKAYVFAARSGTGKSTHTRLWREYFGDRAVMINDDKPLLIVKEDQILACGTPWNGKHHLDKNIIVPVKAICILTRSERNYIEIADKSKIAKVLIQQTYKSVKHENTIKMIDLLNKITKNVEIYKLGCNMELNAVEVAYNGMNEYKIQK